MNLKKRSRFMEAVNNNQTFIIALVAFFLILAGIPAGLMIKTYEKEKFPVAQVQTVQVSNELFWKYLIEHRCQRNANEAGIWYHCDTGWWLEPDLIRVIQNRYPN